MKNSIFIILLICEITLGADLLIEIEPDSIYIGSLAFITVTLINSEEGEIPIFKVWENPSKKFSIVNKILNESYIEYTLQFWEEGEINLPSIPVDIKKRNQEVVSLSTGDFSIQVLSNIFNSSRELRNIKPMQEVELIAPFKRGLQVMVIVLGIFTAVYLWKKKSERKNYIIKGTYKKSNFQDSINQINELPIPNKITEKTTEEFYLNLSRIYRSFISEEFYIKATEMTSGELEEYFITMGLESELVKVCSKLGKTTDMAKYAQQIPEVDQFNKDKNNYIELIKSFHKTKEVPVLLA